MTGTPSQPESSGDEPIALLEPRGGVPPIITTADEVADLAMRLASGSGPVAVDAERASGYRYSQRAQLVQLHREGAGTALIDPIAVPDLRPVNDALRGVEWVLHAAIADLPCLDEIGLRPDVLFDSELGGRLAGFERVALGTLTEQLLGIRLAKGHSAADWSIRPLPHDYLVYAALDVEVLIELRNAVEASLREQRKLTWAHEEFEAVRLAPPPAPRIDPWRRVSGLNKLKSRRQYAVAKHLWEARDELAQRLDLAPGRLLGDRSISAAAAELPKTMQEMLEIDGFTRRGSIAHRKLWFGAITAGRKLPERDLPPKSAPVDPNAAPSRWMGKDSDVADRFSLARDVVLAESERLSIPPENLVPPHATRSLAWDPPRLITESAVSERMADWGARVWQRELLAAPIAAALLNHQPTDSD